MEIIEEKTHEKTNKTAFWKTSSDGPLALKNDMISGFEGPKISKKILINFKKTWEKHGNFWRKNAWKKTNKTAFWKTSSDCPLALKNDMISGLEGPEISKKILINFRENLRKTSKLLKKNTWKITNKTKQDFQRLSSGMHWKITWSLGLKDLIYIDRDCFATT